MTHVDKANAYVADVLAGRIPACKWVVKACQRHVDDLKRAGTSEWPYRFDAAKAERICKFASLMPHIEGTWATPTITLEPWQCFLLGQIFGWVKKANGLRRFRKASIYVPRKNAKSTLSAIIGWWMLTKDGEQGAKVYCGATSEKQAHYVFKPAKAMGLRTPKLLEATGARVDASAIVVPATESIFMPIIGNPGDGGNPHLAIVDEYHEHPTASLYDTMKTGTGARRQSLLLVISTAGDNLTGPCRDDWAYVEQVLDGIVEDETQFGIIWTVDEGDDWTTEDALRKANPNWDVSVLPETILPDQQTAIRDVTKQAPFKTKHLNMWVGAAHGWVNMEWWKQCGDSSLDFSAFAGRPCWVALDAAARVDLTSLVMLFKLDDGFAVFANHYVPEEIAKLPQNEQYRHWIAQGWLIATPGNRTDFAVVEEDLKNWSKQVSIQAFAYDPREITDLVNRIGLWANFERVEIRQNVEMISPPMKELEALIATRKLKHENDPVLTWMASNVEKKEHRGGGPVKYYFPTKARDNAKIDGIVALIMALGRAMAAPTNAPSVYSTRGVLWV